MKSIFASGHFLEPSQEFTGRKYVIGGPCDVRGAVSPNSGRALLQLASLYVAEGALELKGWPSPSIKLLYSWTCAICEGRFSYGQLEESIELIEVERGEAYSEFPYPHYPNAFREVPARLVALTNEEQASIRRINSAKGDRQFELIYNMPNLAIPRHQVGGEPYFVSPEMKSSLCPKCQKEMSFLAAIGNNSYCDSFGFTGNDFVQVVYQICAGCGVVSADNYAD
jgi:hypothetical protein